MTCVATTRKGRDKDIVPFSKNQMKQIERFSSLYRQPFYEKDGVSYWELTVKISFKLLGIYSANFPQKLLGNFYKCADGSFNPHYVSWNPIATEQPDFHQPDFFGDLIVKA